MKKMNVGDYKWGQVVSALGMTDTALRRWLQRDDEGIIKLDRPSDPGDRSSFTLWDVARLALTRDLVDLGLKVKHAFRFSSWVVEKVFDKALIAGKREFSEEDAKPHKLLFVALYTHAGDIGGKRLIKVDPNDPDSGRKELALAVMDGALIRSVDRPIVAAWDALPYPSLGSGLWVELIMDRLREANDRDS